MLIFITKHIAGDHFLLQSASWPFWASQSQSIPAQPSAAQLSPTQLIQAQPNAAQLSPTQPSLSDRLRTMLRPPGKKEHDGGIAQRT